MVICIREHAFLQTTNKHLTVEEERWSVGILEHVHFLHAHEVAWVFDVVHEVLVECAAC